MTTPVLLIDDGELESVRALLDQIGAEYEHVRGSSAPTRLPNADRLLITSARLAISLRIQRALAAGAQRATWVVFVSGEAKTQRAALQKAGFDYLIREPVHPAALRVLLQRALFRGADSRRAPRVACGHGVTYKTGFWKQKATLVELSPRGCRLLTHKPVTEKSDITIQIPREMAGGRPLTLVGQTVRVTPTEREGAPVEYTVGVRFGLIEGDVRTHLRAVLAERVLGPAVLTGPVPGATGELRATPAQAAAPATASPTQAAPDAPARHRRKHRRARYAKKITAMEGSEAYMLLCRDLSIGGMRVEPVEDLAVGAKLDLAIQVSAREEPFLVEATVVRDDGEQGMALRFDWIAPESQKRVKDLVAALPAIESLQDDARGQGTILAQRLKPRGKDGR